MDVVVIMTDLHSKRRGGVGKGGGGDQVWTFRGGIQVYRCAIRTSGENV